MIDITAFATGLSEIPEQQFTDNAVLEYMRENPVSITSLNPYLYFSPERYTRNLILHTSLFDLIAICWDIGQKSRIHNHTNQRCWMGIAFGKVQVQNYRLVHQDPGTHFCELAPTDRYIIDADNPAEVDSDEPIHLVVNPPAFGSRAVTLHIYSRPFDECQVYDLSAKSYETVSLSNTSERGRLTSSLAVEKVGLA
ncbi:cysteine dioxygenase family protein [Tunturibacter empetritectus]|uniref:Cysteine dioxygenase family protein n=1 Tax=Tunturiibacter empetritectus TaxID=3069691 RepID=A0AAU7ZH91_9BACT